MVSEEEMAENLRFRLMMIESTKDDPLVEAQMIFIMEEEYKRYDIHIPAKIRAFLKAEKNRLQKEVAEMIKDKQYERHITQDDRMRNLLKERYKLKKLEEQTRLSGMTRTQQIFGVEGTKGARDQKGL
ncbi:MAG: hypothetical protein GXP63_02990 [DPANN group archaeon]|nr:hypothetical protein [DPANN group archaeon]